MDQVIYTEGLARQFGPVTAVDDLALTVARGEIFGFLGHNGAGKTTTVRLLNGVLEPSAGHARVLGLDPVTQGPALRARTGVLTETPSLDERLTGRENLSIYADLYGVAGVTARVTRLLEVFDLAERGDEKVGGYSKGMKQRLALARSLIHGPELIFLDEPTSGLDPVAARQVLDLIQYQSRQMGHTVFLCTHNLEEAQRVCDRLAVMEQGRMIALGAPDALAGQAGLGVRFEIEVSPPDVETARRVLDAMPAIARHSTEGAVIRIDGDERERIPDLLAALVSAGVRVYRVIPLQASLEDIYFALHDRGQRAQKELAL